MSSDTTTMTKNNWQSATGFYLGIASVFLGGLIGLLPIAAMILSGIGLATFDSDQHKNKWMGAVGLILGALFTLVYMKNYGHL
jgi:hypothetical protein